MRHCHLRVEVGEAARLQFNGTCCSSYRWITVISFQRRDWLLQSILFVGWVAAPLNSANRHCVPVMDLMQPLFYAYIERNCGITTQGSIAVTAVFSLQMWTLSQWSSYLTDQENVHFWQCWTLNAAWKEKSILRCITSNQNVQPGAEFCLDISDILPVIWLR